MGDKLNYKPNKCKTYSKQCMCRRGHISGFVNVKMMWILCCDLHSHQIPVEHLCWGGFWSDVLIYIYSPHYPQKHIGKNTQAALADQCQFLRPLHGISVGDGVQTCSYIFEQTHVSGRVVPPTRVLFTLNVFTWATYLSTHR